MIFNESLKADIKVNASVF